MSCVEPEKLGRYFDGELDEAQCTEVESHIKHCPMCRSEVEALSSLRDEILSVQTAEPPAELWGSIEQSLETATHSLVTASAHQLRKPRRFVRFRAVAGIAAVVAIGAFAAFWFGRGSPAQAAVDFAVLLDSISDGAVEAFDRFVAHHDGVSIDPNDARRSAPDLDFEVPAMLPGGWRRGKSYRLEFGGSQGVATSYSRDDGEFLATIFHPPVRKEEFGTHRDFPCVIGKHRGHAVQVGDWRMVHLTDPSTCHCVLSRITDDDQLASVMNAIAPRSRPSDSHGD